MTKDQESVTVVIFFSILSGFMKTLERKAAYTKFEFLILGTSNSPDYLKFGIESFDTKQINFEKI